MKVKDSQINYLHLKTSKSKLKEISNEFQTSEERNKTASVAPPSVYDQIGPADPVSNIRPIRYFVPENESRLHKKYRLFRQETHNFSHQFWENHNVQFAEVTCKYK